MKIGGFQPFTLSDFPGRAAAIVFTQGCNFRCPYCHNRQLWPFKPKGPTQIREHGVLNFLKERRNHLSGLVITGGEPTLQTNLLSFVRKVKQLGLGVKLDTNGSRPAVLKNLLEESLVDYIAMDIKAPFAKYDALCGGSVNRSAIQSSIRMIATSEVPHHFRTTFYQELLSDIDIRAIRGLLPLHSDFCLQPYREPKHNRSSRKRH
jgi:pyruvate formate lyase activating enzyme